MMNDETEQFERRVSRQRLRQVPSEWRAEILTAAHDAQAPRHPSPATRRSWPSTISDQLSTLLWPHPKAWAGLAAVWILIFVLNFSIRDKTPVVAEISRPPSPEILVELKKQQRMSAELVGSYESADADWHKVFSPRPRSERMEILTG